MKHERALTVAVVTTALATALAFGVLWRENLSVRDRLTALEARSGRSTTTDAGNSDAGTQAGAASESVTWTCAGTLTPDALRAFLADHGRDVLACGAGRVRAGAAIDGTVVVRVRFDAQGRATHVRFAGALRDPGLEACVVGRAPTWRTLPLTSGDCATIELPFRIGPASADAGAI